jgi:predicted ABC-type ATPase
VSPDLREQVLVKSGAGPILIFLAGPNGAGKSTFYRSNLEELGLPFVNADVVAAELRRSRRRKNVDQEAMSKAEDLRRTFLEGGVSFCT